MFFDGSCLEGYVEYCAKTPDFRMFYIPPVNDEKLFSEQKTAVMNRIPETIIYADTGNENYDNDRMRFLEMNGYVCYAAFESQYGGQEYFYVREDFR